MSTQRTNGSHGRRQYAGRYNDRKKSVSRNAAKPHPNNDDPFMPVEDVDALIVATAAGRAANSQPFCEQDVEKVISWARGVRVGAAMLGLVLDGRIMPMGTKGDGEIAYRPVVGTLSRAAARSYHAKLAQLQAGWEVKPPPLEFELSRDEDLSFVLAEPEEAALRLAVEIGNEHWKGAALDPLQMLKEAAECRNDEILLASVLVGDVLPLTDDGGQLTFRHTDELPPADQKEHRRKLRQLLQVTTRG